MEGYIDAEYGFTGPTDRAFVEQLVTGQVAPKRADLGLQQANFIGEKEVMDEWERRQRAGETVRIFRSEEDELRARLKMTDELWSQIRALYEKSGNIEKKTRATKRDDQLLGHGVALLERLSDLQRANIRQFRTFLTRPAPESKIVK